MLRRLFLLCLAHNASGSRLRARHFIFRHFPKTGGTSMRLCAMGVADELNATFMTHYGAAADRTLGHPYRRASTADIIYGHMVSLNTFVAPTKNLFATMFRDPLGRETSLFLHYQRASPEWALRRRFEKNATVATFFARNIEACPVLKRRGDPAVVSPANEWTTECNGEAKYWWPGPARATAPAARDRCASMADAWTSRRDLLVLITGRYDESVRLLRGLLGLRATPEGAVPVHNAAAHAPQRESAVSFDDLRSFDAVLDSTCLPTIYSAAETKFEDTYAWSGLVHANKVEPDLARALWTASAVPSAQASSKRRHEGS